MAASSIASRSAAGATGWGRWTATLERDEAHLIECEGLQAVQGRAQVPEVDGVEGAAEDADHSGRESAGQGLPGSADRAGNGIPICS